MSRTLRERARDWVWWLEQLLHAGLGAAIAYAFADAGAWAAWGLSATLGLARELIQNLRWGEGRPRWDGSKSDAAVDTVAWWVGAAIASAFA